MSAAKARKPRTVSKPPTETLLLDSVSITIPKPKLFTNEEPAVTFAGENLAAALRYVALVCPNLDRFTGAEYVAIELAGIAEICKGLSDDADLPAVDCNAVFHSLYVRLEDLASRITAGGERLDKLETITITRTQAAAEVAS